MRYCKEMTQRIYERIREILDMTPGLTQRGLAERMGLDPAAVNRMLYGKRNIMAEEIPMIEEYLGVHLNISAPMVPPANMEYRQDASGAQSRRGFSDAALQAPLSETPVVPVYGTAGGGLHFNLSSHEPVDWVPRHPAQLGITNAFAVYVFSEAMEPRYFPGELVYVHPGRPPEANRDCLIQMKNGDGRIMRFLRLNNSHVCAAEYNPAREVELARNDIKAIYAIIGRG